MLAKLFSLLLLQLSCRVCRLDAYPSCFLAIRFQALVVIITSKDPLCFIGSARALSVLSIFVVFGVVVVNVIVIEVSV